MLSVNKSLTTVNVAPDYLRFKTQQLQENKTDVFALDSESEENKLKTLFLFATQHLYNPLLKTIPNFKDKKIVVTGSVRNDGVGDYYHVTNTAQQLKKAYPGLKIDVIPIFYFKKTFPSIKMLDPLKFETLLCKDGNITDQALQKIKQADLLLEVSQRTLDKKFIELVDEKKLEEKYQFIGEYGFKTNAMGIRKTDLGIVLKEKPKNQSLLDVENMPLKELLFNNSQPSKENLENYLKNHELFTAYLKAGSYYQIALIYTIVAFQDNSFKTIDICIPEVDLNLLDTEHLKKHGIGKICVVKNSKGDVITNELKLGEEGKELRVINPFPLSQRDFHTLMLNSNPLVGCTGDHSLSEVLSFNRLPFYEVREMKRDFWGVNVRGQMNGIVHLSGEVGGPKHYLQQFFIEISEIYDNNQGRIIMHYDKKQRLGRFANPEDEEEDLIIFKDRQPKMTQASERMGKLLQTSEIYQEMAQFSHLLKEQYNYNEIPKDIVARKLALQTYPELRHSEKELYNKFMAKEIDSLAVNTFLKQKIESLMT